MQIHEITARQLDEGILDQAKAAAGAVGSAYNKVKGGVQGAVQGYQQSQNNRQVAQATKDVAEKASKVWLQYAQQLKAATPDPTRYAALYKQALTAFVQKNLLKGQNISSAINRQEINQLIDSITATEANPAQVTQLMSKLAQQTSVSQQEISTGDELPSTTAGTTDTTDQSSAPVATGYTVPAGRRIRVQTTASGAEQPSFYYKKSDGTWENQLGEKVQSSAYNFLEKLISATKGARIENDPNAPIEAPQVKTRSKKSRSRAK